MPALATTDDLITGGYVKNSRPEDVAFLQNLLNGCSLRIIRYTGRNFFPDPPLQGQPLTDTAAPVTKGPFIPRRSPFIKIPDLREVTLVTLGEVALDSALPYPGYELWGGDTLLGGSEPYTHIKLLNIAFNPYIAQANYVFITGRWGFAAVPDDVKDACCLWVARAFKKRDANYADTVQQGIEGAMFQYFRNLPTEIQMTLDSYRGAGAKVAIV